MNGGQPCQYEGTLAVATLTVGHRYTLSFHQVITGTSGSLFNTWAEPDDGQGPSGATCHIGGVTPEVPFENNRNYDQTQSCDFTPRAASVTIDWHFDASPWCCAHGELTVTSVDHGVASVDQDIASGGCTLGDSVAPLSVQSGLGGASPITVAVPAPTNRDSHILGILGELEGGTSINGPISLDPPWTLIDQWAPVEYNHHLMWIGDLPTPATGNPADFVAHFPTSAPYGFFLGGTVATGSPALQTTHTLVGGSTAIWTQAPANGDILTLLVWAPGPGFPSGVPDAPPPWTLVSGGNGMALYARCAGPGEDVYDTGNGDSFSHWNFFQEWSPDIAVPVEAAPPGTSERENDATSRDPVQTFSGAFQYSFNDLAIAGRGPTPSFTRSYSSADTRVGPLGPGWTDAYATRLRSPGDGSGDLLFVGPDGNTDRYIHNPDDSFSPPPAVYRTLVHNPDGSYTAKEINQSSWSFDASGSLIAISDAFGNVSTLGYDGQGQLVSVSDPAGRGSLSLAYTNGLLTSVTDWASPPRTVSYEYDANGRLWKVTDREGQTTTFGYDGTTQHLTTITDALSHVALTMTYDAQGRVATQKDAQGLVTGATTTFGYVVNGDGTRVTTVTYPPTSFEPAFSPTVVDSYNDVGWILSRVSRPTTSETLTQTYTYDATGNRTSVTDPRGNTTDLCYDTSSAGTTIIGSRGNLTRRIDPAPSAGANRPVTLYTYDTYNNPTQVVAPKGVPSGVSVGCSTDLSAINTMYATDLAYDATATKLVSTTSRYTDPESGATTAATKFEYTDAANPGLATRVIPPRGNTGPSPDYTYAMTFTYGSSGTQAGMLIGTSDALGNSVTAAYDAVGRTTSVVDPIGNAAGGVPADHTTEHVYDNEDRIRFVKLPAPLPGGTQLITEARYDAVGNRTVQIDANGQVTTYAYDVRDGLFQVNETPNAWTDPLAPPAGMITTEYSYDAAGNLSRMTRAKGDAANERVTDYTYDGRDLVRRETQYPSWPATTPTLVTASAYDPNGNPTSLVDPLGRTTTSAFDRLDRTTGIDYSDPGTPDVTYGFDANGNRTSMVDGTGSTSYVYDEANQLIAVTNPGPKIVGYRYDLDGNRTRLIYPDGTAVTYVFNKASQLTSLQDWASRSVSYTYWPDGAPKTATNPDASVATHNYDNARRVTDILHQKDATTIGHYTYTLDSVGNVIGLQDGAQPNTYGLDRLYRLTTVTGPDGNRTYGYDPVGNRTSLVLGGTTTYAYDRADRILSLQGPPVPGSSTRPPSSNDAGWTSSANAYTSNNSYATSSPAKNATTAVKVGTFGFNSTIPSNATVTGVTVSVEWKVSTTSSIATLGAQAYVSGTAVGTEFVNAAEPTSDLTQSFTVTGLTRAQLLNGVFQVRVRATRGNSNAAFTARLDAVTVRVDYTVPAAVVTIASDANGNTTAKGADTYTYDQGNRLTTATVAGATETYAYVGDGNRFSRTVGVNPAIRYVSDVNTSLPVTLDDGTRKYVWGLGLAYAVSGGTLEIYHTDRLGSVRSITNAAGVITATYRTDEFGVPTASTGSSTQPFGFTGEPRDGTGFSYLRARYYDPSLGRFMSRDPVSGSLHQSGTLDRYPYAGQNPVTAVDPSGLWTVGVCVTFSVSLFGLGGQVDGCVVASTNLQVAVTLSPGAGGAVGAVPVSGSAGLVAQVTNADYVEDLAGPFYNVGGSVGAGVGAQGSVFGGEGRCGQFIGGVTFGAQITTPQAGVYGTGTGTAVRRVLGGRAATCGTSNSVSPQAAVLSSWHPSPFAPVDSSMTSRSAASKNRVLR